MLWAISEGFVFHYDGRSFAIPGYMVWAALAYAGVASGISWLLGRPLIRLNADHYAREADMRASLVRASRRHRRHHGGDMARPRRRAGCSRTSRP